jgi:hypothetical protein
MLWASVHLLLSSQKNTMKRILLSTALSLFATAATYAQPILTGSQINPMPGDMLIGHEVTPLPTTVGAAGAGVTWNFGAFMDGMPDTITYVSCASTPYCDSFMGSTVSGVYGSDYNYLTANSDSLSSNGFYSAPAFYHYSNPSTVLKYPFTFNSMFVDTAEMGYSATFLVTNFDSSYADAYGTLILPSGTFANTLRVYTRSIGVMTTPGFPPNQDTAIRYAWYSPGFHSPLLSIQLDNSSGSWEINYASYLTTPVSTTVHKVTAGISALKVYPTPANDIIHISFALSNADQVHIALSDVTGKTIEVRNTNTSAGNNELSIPVADLPAGMYLLRVHTANETITNKISVVH